MTDFERGRASFEVRLEQGDSEIVEEAIARLPHPMRISASDESELVVDVELHERLCKPRPLAKRMDEVERYRRVAARAGLPFVETVAPHDSADFAAHLPLSSRTFSPSSLDGSVSCRSRSKTTGSTSRASDPCRREAIAHTLRALHGIAVSFSLTHPAELTRAPTTLYGERPARPRGELRRYRSPPRRRGRLTTTM